VLGPHTAFFGAHVEAVRQGREIVLPGDPNPHNPIHVDDMTRQIEPLLDAAATNALIVNWCGDEVVTTQETLARTSAILGKPARIRIVSDPAAPMGNANDTTRRLAITGPCSVPFWTGFQRLTDEMTR
jgi:uncharacterized protein YbjT (DUF2867 family)